MVTTHIAISALQMTEGNVALNLGNRVANLVPQFDRSDIYHRYDLHRMLVILRSYGAKSSDVPPQQSFDLGAILVRSPLISKRPLGLGVGLRAQ